MDDNKETKALNVLSLFAKPSSAESARADNEESTTQEQASCSFEETMRKNAENAKRMKDSRIKANQSVIRSYRLKT